MPRAAPVRIGREAPRAVLRPRSPALRRPASSCEQRLDPIALDEMRGEAAIERVRRIQPRAGQAEIAADVPGQRFRKRVAPTSGKSPIPVSGIAKSVRSVAIR